VTQIFIIHLRQGIHGPAFSSIPYLLVILEPVKANDPAMITKGMTTSKSLITDGNLNADAISGSSIFDFRMSQKIEGFYI
jgi:hypothetical protein